jgi:hypothetical protein
MLRRILLSELDITIDTAKKLLLIARRVGVPTSELHAHTSAFVVADRLILTVGGVSISLPASAWRICKSRQQ